MHYWGGEMFIEGEALSEYYITSSGGLTDDPSLQMTPTPTPSPTPEPTVTPSPTPKPTPTPVPQPVYSPQEIHSFIERFSGQYGVDPNVIRHIAVCESGFNPSVANLSYAGLFQFGPNTWINYRQLMGEDADTDLRFNAEEAVQTAAFAYSMGDARIWPNCTP